MNIELLNGFINLKTLHTNQKNTWGPKLIKLKKLRAWVRQKELKLFAPTKPELFDGYMPNFHMRFDDD